MKKILKYKDEKVCVFDMTPAGMQDHAESFKRTGKMDPTGSKTCAAPATYAN